MPKRRSEARAHEFRASFKCEFYFEKNEKNCFEKKIVKKNFFRKKIFFEKGFF